MIALLRSEWQHLRRAPIALFTLIFFALLMVVLFYFSLPMGMGEGVRFVPFVTWWVILFGGILQCNRSFDAERDQEVLDGFRLVPNLLPNVYLAKLLTNILSLIVMVAAVIVMMIVFFNFPPSDITASYILPSLLGVIGLSAVGTFFAAMVRGHHKRDMILPVLLFPILAPLALSVVRWYAAMQNGEALWETPWGHLVIAFDIILTTACWMMFPTLLDD